MVGRLPLILTTAAAMAAFAGNSLIARLAIRDDAIDPIGYTAIRLVSGALFLWILLALPKGGRLPKSAFDWRAAPVLFAYAVLFSLAYLDLSAGTGALLLFGSVQVTMIAYGLIKGERFSAIQTVGALLALGGMIYLTLPGVEAPPLHAALLMAGSGVAWGFYSLLGAKASDASLSTAANFVMTTPLAAVLALVMLPQLSMTTEGVLWATLSGAVTSGLGYILWYRVMPELGSLKAAITQLAVPVIAGVAGALFLAEAMTPRLAISTLVTLGGIGLVVWSKALKKPAP